MSGFSKLQDLGRTQFNDFCPCYPSGPRRSLIVSQRTLSTYYALEPVSFVEQLCGWRTRRLPGGGRGLSWRKQWPAGQECNWASVLPPCAEGHLRGDLLGNCEQVLGS